MRRDEQAFKVAMALVMSAALGFSPRWAIAAETVKDCGGKRVEGTVTIKSGQVERTTDCFEEAFSNCQKATWLYDMEDAIVIQYSIEGKDTASGKCVGGYKYLKHPIAPHLVDQHIHCKLDRSITPFLQSFAMAGAGTSEQRRATCEGPVFETQENFFK